MIAGKLRHVVTIQAPTETQDATGQAIESYRTFATVHAGVKPLGGNEMMLGKELIAYGSHVFTIRYLDGVTPKMRLTWLDRGTLRIFDINNINNPDDRHIALELTCQERAG